MEIQSVLIEGFRNIEKTSIEFSDITSVIGLNAYGKSNVLDAINFAFKFISADIEKKSELMANSIDIPINKSIASKNFRADFDLISISKEGKYLVNYGFEFAWINNEPSGQRIVEEWLKIKLEGNPRYVQLINRQNNKSVYCPTKTSRCNKKIAIDANNLIINKLSAFDDLFYSNIIRDINTTKVYTERHLDSSSLYELDPIIRKGFQALDIHSIQNIPRTIFYLKKDYPEKYELLEDAYMKLFPQIVKIEVVENDFNDLKNFPISEATPFYIADKVYALIVKDKNLNQPINFDKLSDGCKRVFLMLTYAIVADIKNISLIAIEEPENSVHPSLLQSYLRILMQLSNSCKVLLASHSPYIIECIPPHDIYVGIPNNNALAEFYRIAKSKVGKLIKDSSIYSSSTGNYIFELLSGNEDDIDQMKSYLVR